jgi:acetolactate synthase-1/2/3 large subunit
VKSENPCIFIERSGRDPQAVAELVRLSELLALPVSEASGADRVNFPATHAHFGTGPAAREADVVLVLESVAPFMPGRDSPGADAKIAWIGVDPVQSRYKTMEYRADLWIPASVTLTLRAIHEAATAMLDRSDLSRIADRAKRLEQRRKSIQAKQESDGVAAGRLATPTGRWVARELGRVLDPEAILLNDAISNGDLVRAYASRDQCGTYFRSGSSAGGWGSGASFGAKMAAPGRDVVLASGDGYFSFGTPMAALWAASYHKAPYLSVVFVNGSYSTGTSGLRKSYPEGYAVRGNDFTGGTFDPPPDFAKQAEAAGGYGEYVTEAGRVGAALEKGLQETRRGSPAVIAVRVPGPLQQP